MIVYIPFAWSAWSAWMVHHAIYAILKIKGFLPVCMALHGRIRALCHAEPEKLQCFQDCMTAWLISHTLVGVNRPGACRPITPRKVDVARDLGGRDAA